MAMGEYRGISGSTEADAIRITADISIVRCLSKLNRVDEAIAQLQGLLSGYGDQDGYVRVAKCRARVMLLGLCQQSGDKDFPKELAATFDYATRGMATSGGQVFPGRGADADEYIPASVQLFVLNRVVNYTRDMKDTQSVEMRDKSEQLIRKIRTSLMVSEEYGSPTFVKPNVESSGVFRLDTKEPFYGVYKLEGDYTYLTVFTPQQVAKWFDNYLGDVQEFPSLCRVYDGGGRFVAGSQVGDQELFIKTPLKSGWFPGWVTELYIEDYAFEDAAGKPVHV